MYPTYTHASKPDEGVRCSHVVTDGLDHRGARVGNRVTCHAAAAVILMGKENNDPICAIRCRAHAIELLSRIGVCGPIRDYLCEHGDLPVIA